MILLNMTEEGGVRGGKGGELLFWSRVNDVTGGFSKRKCKDLQSLGASDALERTCWMNAKYKPFFVRRYKLNNKTSRERRVLL